MNAVHLSLQAKTPDALLRALKRALQHVRRKGTDLEYLSTPVLAQLCYATETLTPTLTGRGALRSVTLHAHAHDDGSASVVLSITPD